MKLALRAAARARPVLSPNPRVGAVWKSGGTLWTGHYATFGGPHAEASLFGQLGSGAGRGDLWVTLEPCTFRGKTPACVDAVLERRPRRVTIAVLDPDPRVAGQAVRRLRQAGIDVEVGVGALESVGLNLPYFMHRVWDRASVTLKLAASLDGKLATSRGESQWITGEPARVDVHRDRSRTDGILVGSGTVRADDPSLTVRHVSGPEPSKIVIDSGVRVSPDCGLYRAWHEAGFSQVEPSAERQGNYVQTGDGWKRFPRLILATARGASPERLESFRERGWDVWLLPTRGQRVSLRALVRRAGREGLFSLLAEAGPELASALIDAELVDELRLYQAPVILGGDRAWSGNFDVGRLRQARRLEIVTTRRLGEDLKLTLRRPAIAQELLSCLPGWSKTSPPSKRSRR